MSSPRTPLLALLAALATAVLTVLLLGSSADAVPARPGVHTYVQPDGSRFEARAFGDEWYHGDETRSGYTILRGAGGWWRYAEKAPDGSLRATTRVGTGAPAVRRHLRDAVLLRQAERRSARAATVGDGVRLDPTPSGTGPATGAGAAGSGSAPAADPSVGSDPSLVILTEFTDQASLGTTPAQWSDAYFGPGRSVRDYYQQASGGRFTFDPAQETSGTDDDGVVGWVQVPTPHPNTGQNIDTPNRLATREAILAADPYVDYASYDVDRDGVVSNVELHLTVVAAGQEASYDCCSGAKIVWGHRWALYGDEVPSVDGVRVGGLGYTQFGEKHGDHLAAIGIMVHELGHDLALPDLYDVDGSSAGMGNWSVMSYGSWGSAAGDSWQGQTPPLFDAWSRWYAGWIDPQTVTGTEARSLDAATLGSPDAAVVLGDNPAGHADWGSPSGGEYFLVENRQATPGTYDASLPGSGLLVLHVDEAQWSNSVDTRRLVDVVEADGLDQLDTWGSYGDPGDLYRADGNTAFTDTSVPHSRLYDGSPSGAAMTDVGDGGDPMWATFTSPGPTTRVPANDDFAAATTIDGPAGSVDGDNVGAGAEPGEPNPAGAGNGTSVWWRWTAPADGPVTFDTFGPGIVDTVLGVYTGDDVAATTTVAEDDDLDANQGYRQSRVTFRATAGTTYSILVDGHAGLPTGDLRLNWSQEVVVPTNLAAALAVVDPPRGTTFAYRLTLTRSGGDDLAEVPVTLTLPTSVTPVALPTGCSGAGTVTCLLDAVPSGTSRGVDVVVEPRSAGPHPATARLDAVDAEPGDDVASATAGVADVCDNDPTAGNDVVTGTAGADVLCGLAGNDTFQGRGGDDLVFAGAGTDTLSYAASTGAMVVDLGAQALSGATALQKGLAGDGADRATEVEQVVGTRYADTITGSSTLADGLWGGAGNDVVSGLGGADRLFGDAGADRLYGGDGNDRLVGGTGADRLDGGAQVDVCRERSDRRVACER